MSYDIEVLPRRPGQSWEQALDAAEVAARSVTLPPELRAAWERIVARASEILGATVTAGESRDGSSLWLDDEATTIQLTPGAGSAGISVPLGEGREVAGKAYMLRFPDGVFVAWLRRVEQA